jgi:hypothetical protein
MLRKKYSWQTDVWYLKSEHINYLMEETGICSQKNSHDKTNKKQGTVVLWYPWGLIP